MLAKERYGLRERELGAGDARPVHRQTRMSGVDLDGRSIRKGAADAVRPLGRGATAARSRPSSTAIVDGIARRGGTPLVVAERRDARSA